MSLPLGGPISMSQINTELVRSSTAQISLDSAEDGSYAAVNNCSYYKPSATNPAAMSEWRGYNHQIMCPATGYCGSGGKGLLQATGGQTVTHTLTIGNGPGVFKFRIGIYCVYPGQSPTSGTTNPLESWYRVRIKVANSDYDILCKGGVLYGGSGYYLNLESPPPGGIYDELFSWILSGSSQVSITADVYSPDLLLNFAYWFECIISGSLVALHWSPDTFAHACDSSYVYYQAGEPAIEGYSGYKNFLVSGNGTLSAGNTIYGFPSGSATSTYGSTNHNSSGFSGFTGGLSYTFPTYNSACYVLSGQTRASIGGVNGFYGQVAADGYYSDGTNWALVSGGGGVIASTGVCYYTLTWTISIATYYNDSQGSISSVVSHTGNGTWSGTSNVTNGAVLSLYGYGHTYGGLGGVTVDIQVDGVLQATSTADPTTSASYSLTMDGNHSVTISIYDGI